MMYTVSRTFVECQERAVDNDLPYFSVFTQLLHAINAKTVRPVTGYGKRVCGRIGAVLRREDVYGFRAFVRLRAYIALYT